MLALSNESITINGKQFFVLKIIGRGGSSKVTLVYKTLHTGFTPLSNIHLHLGALSGR